MTETITRQLSKQLYLPKISAHRHLTRPQQRHGITNKSNNFKNFPTKQLLVNSLLILKEQLITFGNPALTTRFKIF